MIAFNRVNKGNKIKMKLAQSSRKKFAINLEKEVSREVLVKLRYLCRKRKLKFPEGVVFMLQEVSEPHYGKTSKKPAGN